MTDDSGLTVALIAFLCVFGGALAGMSASRLLPEHHRTQKTEDVIKLGTSVIATMSALVIGLLIASAKESFDTKDGELKQQAGNIILLDRNLAHYGPESKEARDLLRRYAVYTIDATWPREAARPADPEAGFQLLEGVQERVRAFTAANDVQAWLRTRALQVSSELAQSRWLLQVQRGAAIPPAFLAVLVVWLAIIFTSFGLFAPRNGTAVGAMFVCALSVSGSLFLIVSMAHPFGGVIHISSAPMREALAMLGR